MVEESNQLEKGLHLLARMLYVYPAIPVFLHDRKYWGFIFYL